MLDHLKIDKAHFVGYSMGGMITLKLAATAPGTHAVGRHRRHGLDSRGPSLARGQGSDRGKNPALRACARSFPQLGITRDELAAIKVPMVVVIGSDDGLLARRVEPLSEVRPDIPVVKIEGANHMTCVFRPEFRQAIQDFLDKQPAPRREGSWPSRHHEVRTFADLVWPFRGPAAQESRPRRSSCWATRSPRACVQASQPTKRSRPCWPSDSKRPARRCRSSIKGLVARPRPVRLARFDRDVLSLKPRIVVVMYGTNDCYVDQGKTTSRLSRDEFRENLEKMLVANPRSRRRADLDDGALLRPKIAGEWPGGTWQCATLAVYGRLPAGCGQARYRLDRQLRKLDSRTNRRPVESRSGRPMDITPTRAVINNCAECDLRASGEALSDLGSGPVDFSVKLDELLSHDDRKFLWYHPRAVVYPNEFTRVPVAEALITLQKHLLVSDHYDGLATMQRGRDGRWQSPRPVASLAWRNDASGATIAVCDVTPGFHELSGKVLAIGCQDSLRRCRRTIDIHAAVERSRLCDHDADRLRRPMD